MERRETGSCGRAADAGGLGAAGTVKVKDRTPPAACCAPLCETAVSRGDAARAAELFGSLSDLNRVRIVNLLASSGEAACVCELTPELGLAQPTVSFHLKKLLEAGLLRREQRGKWAYYSLRPGALAELATVLDPGARRA